MMYLMKSKVVQQLRDHNQGRGKRVQIKEWKGWQGWAKQKTSSQFKLNIKNSGLISQLIKQMQQSFASVSALLDQVIREEVHNEAKTKNSLYLITSNTEPIHFYDISKIKLIFPQDDLETYLNSNPQITQGSTICLQNCEIVPEYGKDNNVVSCQIQSKSIIIDAGTTNQKKLHSGKIRLQVDKDSGEIPLLPSTRRYIRRMQKQQIARKQSKKAQTQKVDILSFINPKKATTADSNKIESNIFSEQIGSIDSQSIQLLQKLVNFVDKDELFNLLAQKPLKTKISKKAVRLMVIPNAKQNSKQPLVFRKKNYQRQQVQQLCRHYDNLELA